MNRPMKNLILTGIITLLSSACGQLETEPAPTEVPQFIVTVTEIPTNASTMIPENRSDSEMSSKYIGLGYPPLPAGLSERFGMLIQDSNDYGLSLVFDGANKMLWLSKITRYDPNGSAHWEVKDVLDLSNVEAGAILIPDGCSLNGKIDNQILVVAKNGAVILAWRANTTSDVFEVMPANGIECHSDKSISLE